MPPSPCSPRFDILLFTHKTRSHHRATLTMKIIATIVAVACLFGAVAMAAPTVPAEQMGKPHDNENSKLAQTEPHNSPAHAPWVARGEADRVYCGSMLRYWGQASAQVLSLEAELRSARAHQRVQWSRCVPWVDGMLFGISLGREQVLGCFMHYCCFRSGNWRTLLSGSVTARG